MTREVRVLFFQVKTIDEKKRSIVSLAQKHFEKKDPLIIQLPHQKGLKYVDRLLWSFPKESFLPHSIQETACQDCIVLTAPGKNPNGARAVLNLCLTPIDNSNLSFMRIYELEDLISTDNNHFAKERYKTYKKIGYTVMTTSDLTTSF